MRRLIIVPIIHTEVDMGSLAEEVATAYRRAYDDRKWEQHVTAIAEMWRGIETRIDRLALDPARLKVYQDGLPVGDHVADIVADLAARGSANHRLLERLLASGAEVLGTEDPELLLAEYRQIASELRGELVPKPQAAALLARRDRFIAARIAATLRHGDTGLLFIGLLHEVHRYLPATIHSEFLIHRLPFGSRPA